MWFYSIWSNGTRRVGIYIAISINKLYKFTSLFSQDIIQDLFGLHCNIIR